MTALTAKEKKDFRAQGQRLEACAQIGKGGLTPGVIENICAFLRRDGLIKIKLKVLDPEDRKRLAASAATLTESSLISSVGHSVVLYRPLPKPAMADHDIDDDDFDDDEDDDDDDDDDDFDDDDDDDDDDFEDDDF